MARPAAARLWLSPCHNRGRQVGRPCAGAGPEALMTLPQQRDHSAGTGVLAGMLATVDRVALQAWYQRNRDRSRQIFDLLTADAYYEQPIALRHPIVFYEGHLPAFSFNTLVKRGLGGSSIDEGLERLFARGIDPSESDTQRQLVSWPDRATVQAFADEADRRVIDAMLTADLDRPGDPLLD